MTKKQKAIISQIKKLLEDLEKSMVGRATNTKGVVSARSMSSEPKGALGAVMMLIEEGFFDKPKEISAVMGRLKEVALYHKGPAIAMNLLNLTKRRVLNRFKNKESKNWEYVIRK